ncbi:MAG: protein kinase domain-containing protein [Planctomycetota bacterium]|jgi:serine/threonine protein kinase/Tfp pilus assembly protein PilF
MVAHRNDNQADGLDEALTQFVNAYVRGEELDIDEFVEQYPQHETQIRRRVAGLCEIDALFDSLVQADESDFDDVAAGDDLVGQRIGDFEIVAIAGRGGMGVVYRARDTRLDRSVAVKSIPPELAGGSTTRMRFKREAKLLASLNHPNIAVIYDIIEQDEGAGYLILEYVPGQTLTERIAREPLRLEEALSIGRQVAEAVSAAHKKGVVHRDLKPGNIKITPEGRVKVLDFGLAKPSVDEGERAQTTVTQPGRVIGTPAYMSPEQARGKNIDHRTDIWSFGCIMYQMLTGHLPFEGETATDTLAGIIEREPDWGALPQETPANLRVLLRRCLEKNVDSRLGNIAEASVEISGTLSRSATGLPAAVPMKSRTMAMIIAGAVILFMSIVTVWFSLGKQAHPSSDEIRLMVLPFENKGSAEEEYFADGITNDIIARLMNIRILRVISAMDNKREQSAEQMAEELHVDYILRGTVKKEQPTDPNSKVRITFELVKVPDRTIAWRKPYESRHPINVQSDIAKQVPQALEIALLKQEQRALTYVPTRNVEAYDFYLQGEKYFRRSYSQHDLEMAIKMYDKAVKLDPTFALAYCRLSMAHSWMYWFHIDTSRENIHLAWEAVRRAQGLDPDLPEVHQALGRYYYLGRLEYNRALKHFAIARKSQPDNSDILSFIGFVLRRQGKFEEALAYIMKASELSPLSSVLAEEVAVTLVDLRMYEDAERYYQRAITLAPDYGRPYNKMANLYVAMEGNTEKAWAFLNEASQNNKELEDSFTVTKIRLNVYDRRYQEALDLLSSKPGDLDGRGIFTPYPIRYAEIYGYMGNNEKAKEYYEQAINILKSKIAEDPNDARYRSSIGIAYAGVGHKEEAIGQGRHAVRLMSVKKDALRGAYRLGKLARIYVMVGEYDDAISQLDLLAHYPRGMSIAHLRLDPVWDPLRDHPRFQGLLEGGK